MKKAKELAFKKNQETTQLLAERQQEIHALKQNLDALPNLQSQLSKLQEEKRNLESERKELTDQWKKALEAEAKSSAVLENTTATLQAQVFIKEKEISQLKIKIHELPTNEAHQELQNTISQLQQEQAILEIEKNQLIITVEKQTKLQEALFAKEEEILQLQKEKIALENTNHKLSQILEKDLADQEITSMLEAASLFNPRETDNIITSAEKPVHEDLSAPPTIPLPENLLKLTPAYYSIASSQPQQEVIFLQEKINSLQETLDNIMPLADSANNQIELIEKMEKSNQHLDSQLIQKDQTIKNLEYEVNLLSNQLLKAESQIKELQKKQPMLTKQRENIELLSEEVNGLQEELEKKYKELAIEKKQRSKLEQIYKDELEKLKGQYEKIALKRNEVVSQLITDLEKSQPGSCMLLINLLKRYVEVQSITYEESRDILSLIEPAFTNTEEYKIFTSSESEEDSQPNSLEDYQEDSYFPSATETIYQS